jgi:hypothetical protein
MAIKNTFAENEWKQHKKFNTEETILEVDLDKPILPKSRVTFEMEF